MTQYTDKVLERKLRLEQEAKGKEIAYIEGRNGVLKTKYRNGITKYEYRNTKTIRIYCDICKQDVDIKDIANHHDCI
jgi:hypothetical protein